MTESPSIVIGGGLAGSAFAVELARLGRHVVVLEKTAGQHHKVCGEFLSAEAQDLLAQLDIDIWELGARPATHLSLEFANQSIDRIKLPFRAAGLSRFRLDQALLDAATRNGAEVRRGITVTRLERDGALAAVQTLTERLSATHVAFATGKHNLRGIPRPLASTVAFKMQTRLNTAALAQLDDLVHLTMFPGGYAGACLVEEGTATICWVLEQDLLDDMAPEWGKHEDFLSRRSRFLGALFEGATALWPKPVAVAAIPYGFIRRDVISDVIYPLGDQLVVIPSYTGDGTSIALHTGVAAARAVFDKRTAGEFQAATIARLKPQIAWAKAGNVAFVNATAQRVTAVAARLMPWAMPKLATFITNKTRLRA